MAKRKGKFKNSKSKKAKTSISQYTSIKCSFNKILRRTENTKIIKKEIRERSVKAAELSVLSSLLILFEVNKAVYEEESEENIQFERAFFNQDIKKYILTRFRSMTQNNSLQNNVVYDNFSNLLLQFNINKPDTTAWANCFVYNYEQYETSWCTHIKLHVKNRFIKYFKSLNDEHTIKQMKDTATFIVNYKSRVSPDENLLNHLLNVGIVPDPNDVLEEEEERDIDSDFEDEISVISSASSDSNNSNDSDNVVNIFSGFKRGFFKRRLNNQWFQTIPAFIRMQRHIDRYNIQKEQERRQQQQQLAQQPAQQQQQQQPQQGPSVPKDKKKRDRKVNKIVNKRKKYKKTKKNEKKRGMVRNFVVVPICKYKRRHLRYDGQAVHSLFRRIGIIQTNRYGTAISVNRFTDGAIRRNVWNREFNLDYLANLGDRVQRNQRKKKFQYTFTTDSVACSPLYEKSVKVPNQEETKAKNKERYENGGFKYEVKVDPGMKTYIAAVRQDWTEENLNADSIAKNIKIGSTEFHRRAKQPDRDRKAAEIVGDLEIRRRLDREDNYPRMPSANGLEWMSFIVHHLKFFNETIHTYTKPRYTHLAFDKYINTQSAMDNIVNELTQRQSTMFFIGGAKFSASSPIGKYVRCPGTRKLTSAIQKLPNYGLMMVPERNTSQVCPLCLKFFPRETKKDRFKTCYNCQRLPTTKPATRIITKKSKRELQRQRRNARLAEQEANQPPEMMNLNANAAPAVNDPQENVRQQQPQFDRRERRLVSKFMRYVKTNQPQPNADHSGNESNDGMDVDMEVINNQLTTVWHRDIAASECIGYVGRCMLLGNPVDDIFTTQNNR